MQKGAASNRETVVVIGAVGQHHKNAAAAAAAAGTGALQSGADIAGAAVKAGTRRNGCLTAADAMWMAEVGAAGRTHIRSSETELQL